MAPPARLLDLTRLVSRLGRGPMTGIDRVEFAYLAHLLTLETPLFALVRTAAGFLMLDRAGLHKIAALALGGPLGRVDLLSSLTNRKSPARARAETAVRRVAIARCARPFLGRMLRHLPAGTSYLNTGHSNLSDKVLKRLHSRMRVTVLVHDSIPLDHPEYARPDTVNGFAAKLAAVSAHADLVIHSTQDARTRTEAHLRRFGRVPDGVVSPLGVAPPRPEPTELPSDIDTTSPYFVAVGTIEPRKNYPLLIQVWQRLADRPTLPRLYVVGNRGWADPATSDLLDATKGIRVLSGLSDGAVAALLQGATALLFPSFAEGYGLPPVEAAALGTPVIASHLPVIREVMGDYPVYLDPTDSYPWLETIEAMMRGPVLQVELGAKWSCPTWEDHFKTALRLA